MPIVLNVSDFEDSAVRNHKSFQALKAEHEAYTKQVGDIAKRDSETLLGDMVVPFINLPLRKCIVRGDHYVSKDGDGKADGLPFAVVFPQFEKGTIAPGLLWPIQNALPALAGERYVVVERGLHQRLFDPASPYETQVRAEMVDGKFIAMDYQGGGFTEHYWKKGSDGAKNFNLKHLAVNTLVMAIASEKRIILPFFMEDGAEEWDAKVTQWLNKPVSEYLVSLGQRWTMAKQMDRAADTVPQWNGEAVMVGSIDLSKVNSAKVRITAKDGGSNFIIRIGGPGNASKLDAVNKAIASGQKVEVVE